MIGWGTIGKCSRTTARRSRGRSPPTDLNIAERGATNGGTVVIRGIMADASAVGDGEDITVTVMVAGLEASGSPVKLADVTTGLKIEVTAATGLQCDGSAEVATIMFTEGFNSAIRAVRRVAHRWRRHSSDCRRNRAKSRAEQRPLVEFPRHSRRRDRDGEPGGNRNGTEG